jgi:UDP-N-acetylmuramate dehydrogenase
MPVASHSPAFRDFTTLRVGGEIRNYHALTSQNKALSVIQSVWDSGDEWMVLGGGSNIVVSDETFDGHVLHVRWQGKQQKESADDTLLLTVQAGEDWDDLVAYTVTAGLQGLESLSGIPGSVGASVVQNIGAYGYELDQVLETVQFLDYEDRQQKTLTASDLGLAHRTSFLKTGELRGVVLSVTFRLIRSPESLPVAYPQLAEYLGVEAGRSVPLESLRLAVLSLRESKGMVLDPDDSDSRSVGSFFINPVVSEKFAYSLPDTAPKWHLTHAPPQIVELSASDSADAGAEKPEAEENQSMVKLSAAWLIEHSGIPKGFSLSGNAARVSSKHTLALTNPGGATAEDVTSLARYIRTQVANTFGVFLQPEPSLIGLSLD